MGESSGHDLDHWEDVLLCVSHAGMAAGWEREERGCRLDGPRETAEVVARRPRFDSSSHGWECLLGQVSQPLQLRVLLCEWAQ